MNMSSRLTKPPKGYWVVSIVALLWNLIGVATYLMSVTMSQETLAQFSEAERSLYTDIPAWVTSAYAIAVFGGTIACVALLLRKSWAMHVFLISLLAILVQMGHALFITPMLEVKGGGAAVLPVLIIVVAIFLFWYASAAKKKGWLD